MNHREFSFWLMLFNTAFEKCLDAANQDRVDQQIPELVAANAGILADYALLEARKRAPAIPAEPPK